MGRVVTVVGTLISIVTAYSARAFPNVFDYWALLSAIFVGAPFGTFVLGVFTRRVDGTAAFAGMLTGILTTIGHFALYHYGYLHYGSDLSMDFYGAGYGFFANVLVAGIFTVLRPGAKSIALILQDEPPKAQAWYMTPQAWAILAAVVMIILNIVYW